MQTVTFTFFHLSSPGHQFWALKQMQLGFLPLRQVKGLTFFKLMGAGSGNGFRWFPDFSTYGLLGVWENEKKAEHFFTYHPFFQQYRHKAEETYTVFLHNLESHGKWSGQNPFKPQAIQHDGGPIAVLTRATIRPHKLWEFWSKVNRVSDSIDLYPGKLFSQGIGEWPIVQQATFSLWESVSHMKAYAYQNPLHQEVIKLTRQKKWYREEMFARFLPVREEGIWHGKKPLAAVGVG